MTTIFNRSSLKIRRQVLRRNMPKAEIILWSRIRRKKMEVVDFGDSIVLEHMC